MPPEQASHEGSWQQCGHSDRRSCHTPPHTCKIAAEEKRSLLKKQGDTLEGLYYQQEAQKWLTPE